MTLLLEHLELSILIPLLGGVFVLAFRNRPRLREASSILAGILLFLYVTQLLGLDPGQAHARTLLEISAGLSIAFHAEPLGLVFALLASGLWVVTTVYSIGYLNGNAEKNQTRFYLFFACSIASTMGIAFAANLFTLFIFYEALTLCTYPLVTHKQTQEAQTGGRVYLGVLLGTSIMFFLSALVITWLHAGTLDFLPGGILEGRLSGIATPLLFTLFMFGIGKAALMPFYRWLPAAMVAPTPVSALLHAVAVVKAGVFSVLKISVYVFGIDFIATQDASAWVLWIAVATMLIASVIALSKDNPESAPGLFNHQPAVLHRDRGSTGLASCSLGRRAAHRHARVRQDHAVLLRGGDLYGLEIHERQPAGRPGTQDAVHVCRLPARCVQCDRPAPIRRQLEQVAAGRRQCRHPALYRPGRIRAQHPAELRLSTAHRPARFLQVPKPRGGRGRPGNQGGAAGMRDPTVRYRCGHVAAIFLHPAPVRVSVPCFQPMSAPDKRYWLDRPGNINRLVYGLYALCAVLVLLDLLYHKHTYFSFEGWFGFFGWFGFIACVALVLLAKQMRKLVKRDEEYYGDH